MPVLRGDILLTDFGGGEFTTWDGEPVSRVRPYGATVVVASQCDGLGSR